MHFSPNGGCTDAIVQEIQTAQTQILVQAYTFTSKPIEQALIVAKTKNVSVSVILDHEASQGHNEAGVVLKSAGIVVYTDAQHHIAHNKIIIIDNKTVITGSFNFTFDAENYNAENVLIIKNCPDLVEEYKQNWQNHKNHSVLLI